MTARPHCPAVIFFDPAPPPEATLRHPKRHEATLISSRTNGATGGLTLL